jgi:hypothetical protein
MSKQTRRDRSESQEEETLPANDAFELFRVHAHPVFPRRTAFDGVSDAEAEYEPSQAGGAIQVSAALRDALAESQNVLEEEQIEIDLSVGGPERTSPIRDAVLNYGFGATNTPVRAAVDLATALSAAMDDRSTACLLVIAGYRRGDERRVSMWTFPKDEAFQFKAGGKPSIELLRDIFSRRSRLRKGATFSGKNLKTDFISGGVLDFQATSLSRLAADFWIERFLGARLGLQSHTATKRLVGALRTTLEGLDDPEERAQLHAAILTLRAGPKRRLSMRKFAADHLDEPLREKLLEKIPPEMVDRTFSLDQALLREQVNVRAFDLEGDVLVAAPLASVGNQIRIEGTKLTLEGRITRERLRSRK